jgi:hypothetical protein
MAPSALQRTRRSERRRVMQEKTLGGGQNLRG